jgi:LmbE family N-acetylglucosaminyl deacetylase
MNTAPLPPLVPKIVLGIAAHPDDLDFYAGGTMAAFASQGAEVYYLVLTDGAKGSQDRSATPESLRGLRRDEQRRAAAILGVKDVFFCDYPDGLLENTIDVKREVVRLIRRVRPDVVVAMDPSVQYVASQGFINHPDHRAAGQASLDAVYPLARDHMSFPELLAEGYEPHAAKTMLLIGLDLAMTTFAVDITDTLERKLESIGAHISQFGELDAVKRQLRQDATEVGDAHGYTAAEAFTRIDIR